MNIYSYKSVSNKMLLGTRLNICSSAEWDSDRLEGLKSIHIALSQYSHQSKWNVMFENTRSSEE